MTYTTASLEFKADFSEVVDRYESSGFEAASRRAAQICDVRQLSPSEALTLVDAVRRHLILNGGH